MTNQKNYELFNEITNPELRTWNRCAMIYNLGAEHGPKAMKDYAGHLTQDERNEVSAMFERIEKHGYESTRTEVIRNNQPYAIN